MAGLVHSEDIGDVSRSVSPEEWDARVNLAALYRLVALRGWDDLIFTHISARVPGPDQHFLINPLGHMFEEITASSLMKVDLDGNLVGEAAGEINYAGFVIHSAIHAAREDAHFVIHLHTPDGMAVAGQKCGLLLLNQRALTLIPRLSYHDYEGIALDLDEQERLVAHLGDKKLMILRNHGTLALGTSPGEAWSGIYHLEMACTTQVRTLSAGMNNALLLAEESSGLRVGGAKSASANARLSLHSDIFSVVWDAMLRKLERESCSYAK
jgi:ribulose-5-phosphate 4-epimerase/fuculose-1-phosphate aldolase